MQINSIYRDDYKNFIYFDNNFVVIRRHTTESATENPINEDEKIIDALCRYINKPTTSSN